MQLQGLKRGLRAPALLLAAGMAAAAPQPPRRVGRRVGPSLVMTMAVLLASGAGAAAAPLPPRRVLSWLVPYENITSVDGYRAAWAQWGAAGARAGPGFMVAGSAFALKPDGSFGYASTTAGEALYGTVMEQYGFPALRAMKLPTLAMVYFTHFSGIAIVVKNPAPFIAACVNATLANGLQGVDLDYEPQTVALHGLEAPVTAFFAALANALAAHGLLLTIDVGPGCGVGTDCTALAGIANLTQVNTEDAFNINGVADFTSVVQADLPALGAAKWAPGFEPGNLGVDTFASVLQYAAASATGVRNIATWAVHESNVGPQPEALFDALVAFVTAP